MKSGPGYRGKTKHRGGGRSGGHSEYDPSKKFANSRKNGCPSVAGVQCQICGRLNHSALTCYRCYNHASPTANVVESFGNPQGWYLDSGATHHITISL